MNFTGDILSRRDNMWVDKKYDIARRAIGMPCVDCGQLLNSTHMLFQAEQGCILMIIFYPHFGPSGPWVVHIWQSISSHKNMPNKIILITSMERTTRIYAGTPVPEGQHVGRKKYDIARRAIGTSCVDCVHSLIFTHLLFLAEIFGKPINVLAN